MSINVLPKLASKKEINYGVSILQLVCGDC